MEGGKYNLQQPCAKIGRKLSALVVARVLVRWYIALRGKNYTRYSLCFDTSYHSFWTHITFTQLTSTYRSQRAVGLNYIKYISLILELVQSCSGTVLTRTVLLVESDFCLTKLL